MRKHSISKFNANVFPTACFGHYYYLQCPISQLHVDWLNSHRKVSRTTIYRNLDKNVKPMKKTPHLQCYCKECSNLESKGRALFHEHMPGTSGNARHSVEQTWCQYTSHQYGYRKRDIFNTGIWQFPKMNCVNCKCNKCGIEMLRQRINIAVSRIHNLSESNDQLDIKFGKVVEWEEWGYVNKKLELITRRSTLRNLLDKYLTHLHSMSRHRFHDMWMSHQFNLLINHIVKGMVVFVNDFAQNILLRFQKEPVSVHWIHKQVTLHPSVAYFMCPGCERVVIKEEIFHITSSLTHDWKTVDHFMRCNIQHLKSKGVKIDQIHDVTDNCASQYKSRYVWHHISNSEIPWYRHHFVANHGKGPSDRASGFFKLFIRENIISQNAVLKNVDVLYQFALQNLNNQPMDRTCLHETQ